MVDCFYVVEFMYYIGFCFQDDKYWKFDGMKPVSGYPRRIREGFKGLPDKIDAAFVWSGNGKTYFIKGKQVP